MGTHATMLNDGVDAYGHLCLDENIITARGIHEKRRIEGCNVIQEARVHCGNRHGNHNLFLLPWLFGSWSWHPTE